ncbi:Do family serine endopeptidase [Cellvibrio sp. PSBB023]|uniref:Do family serine endopeptidase n=1 Tax=Cellvibrio sp. PSBB023 TaxID=1945512 RepID=UPI0009901750|nr:Do family serine endopeptidase [Cellvibrio sp. PSBB023]AQT60123.1 serine peptidase [Cellvibrio sp. PSBB023]
MHTLTAKWASGIKTVIAIVSISVYSLVSQAAELPDFTQLIEQHSPAVVKITAVSKGSAAEPQRSLPQDMQGLPDIFRELLERRQAPRDRGSLGSGFIISADGYVLTNDHVVDKMDSITVILNDQREYSATLVGSDERSDLALLKIDAKNLPTLILAKDETLKVGQWVVAIGSPFGLDYSASAGIVSAIGRSIPSAHSESNYVPFIQTDVAINPGNSGGPLFNMDGEVVGINSQIYSPSGGSVGLSFAIPSSLAVDVVAQLKDKGRVDRGWLGVMIQDVDKNLASSLGVDKPMGALISELDADGPAAKSGLKAGDLIIKFNDHAVNTSSDLPYLVGRTAPKSKVPVVIMRKGKQQSLSVTVGILPVSPQEAASRPASAPAQNTVDSLGLIITPLERSQRGGAEAGVVVQQVKPGSPAAEAGIQPGDIITQLAFSDIKSPDDYAKIVKGLPKNEPQAIRFYRQNRPVFRSIVIK